LFNILQEPVYNSSSKIGIKDADIYYNDFLYKYFPEEATALWFTPSYKYSTFSERKGTALFNETSSKKILGMAFEKINLQIKKSDFNNSIKVALITEGIEIDTFYNDPETAYVINKTLLDVYIAEKNSEFENTYNDLATKIDNKIKTIEGELSVLSEKAIESIILINLKYQEELKKQGLPDIKIDAFKIIDPVLSKEIDSKYDDIIVLDSLKQNLTSNKDYFIKNKIQVINEPEKPVKSINSNNKRNIIIAIVAALISSIIVAFIANYFSNRRQKIKADILIS
ncbi:MAG: hypothetical protein ACXWFB_11730, partial [Nitrososphaeraceae archaeon]